MDLSDCPRVRQSVGAVVVRIVKLRSKTQQTKHATRCQLGRRSCQPAASWINKPTANSQNNNNRQTSGQSDRQTDRQTGSLSARLTSLAGWQSGWMRFNGYLSLAIYWKDFQHSQRQSAVIHACIQSFVNEYECANEYEYVYEYNSQSYNKSHICACHMSTKRRLRWWCHSSSSSSGSSNIWLWKAACVSLTATKSIKIIGWLRLQLRQ